MNPNLDDVEVERTGFLGEFKVQRRYKPKGQFPHMATLVFDIETNALAIEAFDEAQQEYLLRDASRLPEGPEREARRDDLIRQLSLYPLTAQVVCIAMGNADSGRGQVLFIADDYEPEDGGEIKFSPFADEAELLNQFWELARRYEHFVTFNGRAFDVPFLYLRSALLAVPISR